MKCSHSSWRLQYLYQLSHCTYCSAMWYNITATSQWAKYYVPIYECQEEVFALNNCQYKKKEYVKLLCKLWYTYIVILINMIHSIAVNYRVFIDWSEGQLSCNILFASLWRQNACQLPYKCWFHVPVVIHDLSYCGTINVLIMTALIQGSLQIITVK